MIAIDIPSGQDVERGPKLSRVVVPTRSPPPTSHTYIHHAAFSGVVEGCEAIRAAILVSLTAPKACARNFQGIHWLGGPYINVRGASSFCLVEYCQISNDAFALDVLQVALFHRRSSPATPLTYLPSLAPTLPCGCNSELARQLGAHAPRVFRISRQKEACAKGRACSIVPSTCHTSRRSGAAYNTQQ